MATVRKLGFDCSNWSGLPTPEQARCIKDAGYEFAIVGCQRWEPARTQIQVFQQAGLRVEAYQYLYFSGPPSGNRERLDLALVLMWTHGLGRLWLDCEDSVVGQTPAQIVNQLRGMITYVQEQAPEIELGIYTGRWWWEPQAGGSTGFSGLPLWHAEYNNNAPEANPAAAPSFDAFVPYGGWTRPAIWQFQGTNSLCEFSVDLNVMEVEMPDEAPITEPIWANIPLDSIRIQLVEAVVNKYVPEVVGVNPVGELVVLLKERDGRISDPPAYLAVLPPGTERSP